MLFSGVDIYLFNYKDANELTKTFSHSLTLRLPIEELEGEEEEFCWWVPWYKCHLNFVYLSQ